jgi:hypothetical protein
MGVIYIGDRRTGKTHLAMELANPKTNYVKVCNPSYENLKALLYDDDEGGTKATDSAKGVYNRYMEIQTTLPTGNKQITVDWLDTAGEIWRKSWQEDNPQEWKIFMENISSSEGVLLVLPPYREMLEMHPQKDEYPLLEQWTMRFNRWVDFFRNDCSNLKHILICLNKADLFCQNLDQESAKLAYKPYNAPMNWQQRHVYVCNKYFRPVLPNLEEINRNIRGLSIRCFITSIHDRSLLELPWLYLASFLAK